MTKQPVPNTSHFTERLKKSFWMRTGFLLTVILLWAGGLRLCYLEISPPGLNQDEAANAWNAYCLLKTGKDQVGVSWPIFYSRCLGGNRSTLFIYLLIPFQAIGGLSVLATRLPSAIGGTVAVWLIYYLGSRFFDRRIGLVAAALMAVNPWALHQSRWGHEAAIVPLLVMLPLALMLYARLPLGGKREGRIRPGVALLAGLVAGICCYGYPSVRLFMPLFLIWAVLLGWRDWGAFIKERRGAGAIVLFVIGLALTFGPLAWKHISEPEVISKRFYMTKAWKPYDSAGVCVKRVLARYPGHFGPEFLFINGDPILFQSPIGIGQFHWYMSPFFLSGLIVVIRCFKMRLSCRILLMWILIYPISDCLNWHSIREPVQAMHALRSMPGLSGLILLGAVGAVGLWTWLQQWNREVLKASLYVLGALLIGLNGRFFNIYFHQYPRCSDLYCLYNGDLLAACDWLRPRMDEIDAVFCTTKKRLMPYSVMMVGLKYEPQQWFRDVRKIHDEGGWDIHTQVGKLHFMYGDSSKNALMQLKNNGKPDRVLFIIKPEELDISQPPLYQIHGPDGQVVLCIYEVQM